jgi:hypothetical protein
MMEILDGMWHFISEQSPKKHLAAATDYLGNFCPSGAVIRVKNADQTEIRTKCANVLKKPGHAYDCDQKICHHLPWNSDLVSFFLI